MTQKMASKSYILKTTTFANFANLYRFLRTAPMRALISSGQCETIADVIDASLPADIALEQRTPKGTVYIYIDGDYFGTVSQNGTYAAPKGATSLGAPLSRLNLPRIS